MKRIIFTVACVFLLAPAALAETMYVSESIEITVRTGGGRDYKVIAMITPGQVVDVVEKNPDWSRIRLPNGKEGWVLTRFLTYEEPSKVKLAKLQKKYEELLAASKDPLEEIQKLQDEKTKLTSELSETQMKLAEVSQAYESLRSESTDFLKVKEEADSLQAQLGKVSQRAELLEDDLNRMERRQIFRWFLSGAGVLFLGWIVGFISRPKRRHSSLLR